MKNDIIKALTLAAVLIYAVSPMDAYPGPIDDIIIALIGVIARKKLSETK